MFFESQQFLGIKLFDFRIHYINITIFVNKENLMNHIFLASSKFRFMYSTASAEFIGDAFNAAIFRILRSDAS